MELIKITNMSHESPIGAIKFVIGGVVCKPGQMATVKASDIDSRLEKAFAKGILVKGEVTDGRICQRVNAYPPVAAYSQNLLPNLSLDELRKMCKAVGISEKGKKSELISQLKEIYA